MEHSSPLQLPGALSRHLLLLLLSRMLLLACLQTFLQAWPSLIGALGLRGTRGLRRTDSLRRAERPGGAEGLPIWGAWLGEGPPDLLWERYELSRQLGALVLRWQGPAVAAVELREEDQERPLASALCHRCQSGCFKGDACAA